MVEPIVVTLFPVLFLVVLFGGGALFRKRAIDMDGDPPIHRTLFYTSKYLIVVLWAITVFHSWGIRITIAEVSVWSPWIALILWVIGFGLLFVGRFGMGESFRIGSPQEKTHLQVNGLFRFSRNPMYVGVYSTVLASVLYTWNPFLLLIGLFIIAVHHQIIIAEERYLQGTFGNEYGAYCQRVRRYL